MSFRTSTPEDAAEIAHTLELAFDEYRDPERFWIICDSSDVLWPPDVLAEPGQSIAIPRGEPGP